MKFYHCFHTDLPDQFVEANANRLIKWVDDWKGKNRYHLRSQIIDMVPVNVAGLDSDNYPTLVTTSAIMLGRWLQTKGHLYNGRYWESLTQDQRSPARIASLSGGAIDPDDDSFGTSTAAMYLAQSRRASIGIMALPLASWRAFNAMHPGGITWADEYELIPKPPLRRDAIIAGEIIGYRCWRIENGLLRSVYQSDIWSPNAILEGRELDDWNERGIHAWKSSSSKEYHNYVRAYLNSEQDTYSRILYGGAPKETKPAMLTGTVFLWGDVVEHERGYRAEYARVRSLDWLYPDETMMGKEQETLDGLRQKYGVGK